MIVGVENYRRLNGIKNPFDESKNEGASEFKAGMNSPNLPWHVNITSRKHRSRFGEVACYPAVRTGSSNTRFVFFWWSLAPDPRSVKTILAGNLCSFSVISPEFS